jgi:hypothetical protein
VRDLDRACLLLCIALLDHTIQGDHFESVVLSFLAVLGIDENPGGVFRGPLSYSSDLSKFIKMAQMLVVQRSVVAAEEGEVEHPSDMLDEMRERFMVRGSRTAFDWACRLRSYAKKVVSNTTSLGYIAWSEDGSSVTYKDTIRMNTRNYTEHQLFDRLAISQVTQFELTELTAKTQFSQSVLEAAGRQSSQFRGL